VARIRVTLVPHTHWDREWYEPFDVFRERLIAMMDTLLDLGASGFPHFHLDGQTAMVDDYLDARPEREPDLRRLAADGRLSLGPWVTHVDEYLTSGETHIRNLEMGLARARELAVATEIGYLPDQFGHVGQMPQILREAGIERAVVWRGVPRSIDRTAFRWEAPDGSSVVAEYLAFGYFLGHDIGRFEDPAALANAIRSKLEEVRPFLAADRALIMVGADHAGPDAALPDRLAAAEPLLPDASVGIASLQEHVDAPDPPALPVWRGELRSSARAHLLPNVYSARASQKRERGRAETLIERYAEPLAALVPGFAWPADRLERAWTLLLWNGAHDSVCGCSHDRVAADVDERNAEVRDLGEAVVAEALASLATNVETAGVLRFNPSPFEREGVPGLGWRVEPSLPPTREEPVRPTVAEGWVEADGIAFRLLDEPDVGDLYNFCPADPAQAPSPPRRLEADGARVLAAWDGLELALRMSRRAGEPFVRLEGEVRNERPDHRLRLHIRLADEASGSLAGSPFELVERGLVSEGGDLEAPSPTWPARHLVLAGGVAAFHEGVFEYEVSPNELAITLLRCVGTISRPSLSTRPWPAGPDVATPQAQMLGATSFAVALRPAATADGLLRDRERFALPLRTVPAPGGGTLPGTGTLLEVSGDAELSSVRRVQGRVEVRLWNPWKDHPARGSIGGRKVELAPARIETLRLEDG
jgi:alpha-mannosidase